MKKNFNNSDNDNANWHDNINYIGGFFKYSTTSSLLNFHDYSNVECHRIAITHKVKQSEKKVENK